MSDFSVLHCQFQRHGQSFADFLTGMEIEGCIDTLVLARSLELPAKLGDVYKPVVPTSARYDSQDQDQGASELHGGGLGRVGIRR